MYTARTCFRTMILATAALLACAGAQAAQNRWVPLGGPAQGGLVRSLLTQQFVPGTVTLIAGIYGNGVYRSTDGGANWSAINSGLGDERVRHLASPSGTSTTVYASTDGGGIYVTTNADAATPSWSKLPATGLTCSFIRRIAIASSAPATFFAGGCGNVYKSTDSGANWTLLNGVSTGLPAPGGTQVNAFRINGAAGVPDTNTVWVATQNNGIYRTTDGLTAAAWVAANGSGATQVGGASPANGLAVYNVVGRTGGSGALWAYVEGAGVYRSTDGGATWADFNTGLPAGKQGRPIGGITSIDTSLLLSIDGDGVYESDNGAAWAKVADVSVLPGARGISQDPVTTTTWYVNSLIGVFKSTDDGATWSAINTGLPLGSVNNTTSHPAAPATIYAAGQFLYKSTDAGATWSRVTALPYTMSNGNVTVDPNNAATVYAGTDNYGFWKSTDSGANWTQISGAAPVTDVPDGARARLLAFDSGTAPGTTVLYGYFRDYGRGLYRSTDGGSSWMSIGGGALSGLNKRFVRHATNSDATIYASTTSGLYKSTDSGSNWSFINPSGLVFRTGRIELDAANPSSVYVAVYATDAFDQGLPYSGVYASPDGGATWAQAASGEKMNTIRLAGSGPTANLFGASWGYTFFNQPGAGRCLQPASGMHFADIQCQDMTDLGGARIRINQFEAFQLDSFVVKRASTLGKGVYKYIYNSLGQDFDGNGAGDVFWRRNVAGNGQTYLWNMDALSVTNSGYADPQVLDTDWKIVGTADFNGDGHTDLLWRYVKPGNSSDGRNIIWLMNNGTRIAAADIPAVAPSANWSVAGTGDFNGDGKADILWRETTGAGRNSVWLMNGTARLAYGLLPAIADQNWKVAGVGDFDGDGKADILWRETTGAGRNSVWLMDGTTRLSYGLLLPITDQNWKVAGVGDFDGDGKADILWRETAAAGRNSVWLMDGTTRLTYGLLAAVPDQNWSIVGLSDYNADGRSDILWRNASTGDDYIWFMNGTSSWGSCGGALGCSANGHIPSVNPASGWGVVSN